MTTLQLKVAVAINDLCSISGAAYMLDISQPNASNYLKSLEKEIGFEIFNRTKSGVTLTEKGHSFIEHAKRILSEQESIMDIQKYANKCRLRVGSANYSPAVEPFLKICTAHRDDTYTDFKYVNVSINDGIMKLINYDLDIIVAPTLKSQLAGIIASCKKDNIKMVHICDLPTSINVRKGHPAALDGRCKNIVQGTDVMKDFPYATYRNLSEDTTAIGYNDSDFIQCSYKILVDGNDVRLRIVSSTNAFSFAIMPTEQTKEKYNIEAFPVPNIFVKIYCLIRENDTTKNEVQDYISILEENLRPNAIKD